MPEHADIYVISNKRDKNTIYAFLKNFLPNKEESADGYEIPQYSENPEILFQAADKLIEYCVKNDEIEHSIYWRSSDNSKPEHGMLFFLKDKNVIYGLSTDAEHKEYAKSLLKEMKDFLKSDLGYIAHEGCGTQTGCHHAPDVADR